MTFFFFLKLQDMHKHFFFIKITSRFQALPASLIIFVLPYLDNFDNFRFWSHGPPLNSSVSSSSSD
jgi:hypothetical protein